MINNQMLSQDRPSIPPYNYQPTPYLGISKQQVIQLRKQHINPVVSTYYQQPIMIVEGLRQYIFDETGKRYLEDFAGNERSISRTG
ncbi:hypothetical protein [Okeania sp.]|uniref:hypothetical protein n=1 Tax=Okeania sp. TaxID=3100323 RepID=UPI002B4ADA25|nr:hypothetical protein [Okeania sp.]MEB3343623.1 hypothetical protein [Okeania sp.]